MFPALFALAPVPMAAPADDRVTALVRREARSGFFAAPVDAPGWSYRSGEATDSLLARVRGLEIVGREGARALARPDRPLLLQHRPRSWESFGRLVPVFLDVAEAAGGANRPIGFAKLSPELRERVRQESERTADLVSDPRVQVTSRVYCQIYISPPGKGDQPYLGMTFDGMGKPFDPARYAHLFRRDDPFPVPPELNRALSRSPAPKAGTRTLAEWLRPYPMLTLDERAKGWTVALAGTGSVGDGLAAIAMASRLYFRPFGDRWMLSASPDEPRAHAKFIADRRAIAGKYELLAPLARAGAIPEDLFALVGIGANHDKASKLGEERIRHVRNLIAIPGKRSFLMTPPPDLTSRDIGESEFAEFMKRHGGSDAASLSVVFGADLNFSVPGGSSFGIGVTFP